jgi:hypothetical protein
MAATLPADHVKLAASMGKSGVAVVQNAREMTHALDSNNGFQIAI